MLVVVTNPNEKALKYRFFSDEQLGMFAETR